jgi:hypothetical protein
MSPRPIGRAELEGFVAFSADDAENERFRADVERALREKEAKLRWCLIPNDGETTVGRASPLAPGGQSRLRPPVRRRLVTARLARRRIGAELFATAGFQCVRSAGRDRPRLGRDPRRASPGAANAARAHGRCGRALPPAQGIPHAADWWQLAYDTDGDLLGLIVGGGSADAPVIALRGRRSRAARAWVRRRPPRAGGRHVGRCRSNGDPRGHCCRKHSDGQRVPPRRLRPVHDSHRVYARLRSGHAGRLTPPAVAGTADEKGDSDDRGPFSL